MTTDLSADEFFREDAANRAVDVTIYYRDHGMIPPGMPEDISGTSSRQRGSPTFTVTSVGDEDIFGLAGGIAGLDGERA